MNTNVTTAAKAVTGLALVVLGARSLKKRSFKKHAEQAINLVTDN